MSFLAHLFINQRKIVVLSSQLGFHQQRDMAGMPRGAVKGSIIWLTIELSGHTDLLHQMMNAEQMVEGYLRFYKRDAMSKLYDYEFWDTYVFSYRVNQVLHSGNPATITIGLSCGVLRANGVVIKKPWHVTDLEMLENDSEVGTDRVPTIIRQYLTDTEANEIKKYTFGDTILLNIATENMQKQLISIRIADKDHDFEYNGTVLDDDTLRNIEITEDLLSIELKVVEPKEAV